MLLLCSGLLNLDHALTKAGVEQAENLFNEWNNFSSTEQEAAESAAIDDAEVGRVDTSYAGSSEATPAEVGKRSATRAAAFETTELIRGLTVSGFSESSVSAFPFLSPSQSAQLMKHFKKVSPSHGSGHGGRQSISGGMIPPISPRNGHVGDASGLDTPSCVHLLQHDNSAEHMLSSDGHAANEHAVNELRADLNLQFGRLSAGRPPLRISSGSHSRCQSEDIMEPAACDNATSTHTDSGSDSSSVVAGGIYSSTSTSVNNTNNNSTCPSESSTPISRSRSCTDPGAAPGPEMAFPHIYMTPNAIVSAATTDDSITATERYYHDNTVADSMIAVDVQATCSQTSFANFSKTLSIPRLELFAALKSRSDTIGSDDGVQIPNQPNCSSSSSSVQENYSASSITYFSSRTERSNDTSGSQTTREYCPANSNGTEDKRCLAGSGEVTLREEFASDEAGGAMDASADANDDNDERMFTSFSHDDSGGDTMADNYCGNDKLNGAGFEDDEDLLLSPDASVSGNMSVSVPYVATVAELRARMAELRRQFLSSDRIYSSPFTRAIETAVVGLKNHPAMHTNGLTLLRFATNKDIIVGILSYVDIVYSVIRELKGVGGLDSVGVAVDSAIISRVQDELADFVSKQQAAEVSTTKLTVIRD
jgi:hypothetical protein